ncbi:hypothetical protein SAMN05444392_10877 [Seinonella peptonophila]|uniref:Uncharacterized protein n=1 Tax=Seinonella peptonophila TaxID=112248 RepID=A0A1M4Z7R2_9BACL|nr:hypothetical protein [Seinonella peptonophila]SHF13827.1 hypothetical protein SAMN05444392_10877 [Seinonella peptonophila]
MRAAHVKFSIAACLMTILFLAITNYLTSPEHPWFLYPAFFLILYPVTMLLIYKKQSKLYSVICSLLTIGYLALINYFTSSDHLWVIYPAYLFLWWPITLYVGKWAKTVQYAVLVSLLTILYYGALNFLFSPDHPWVIYIAFLVLWWPIALHYSYKRNFFGLSIAGTILSALFFITANFITTPHTIWAIYPIFLMLWWPLSMYYFSYARKSKSE